MSMHSGAFTQLNRPLEYRDLIGPLHLEQLRVGGTVALENIGEGKTSLDGDSTLGTRDPTNQWIPPEFTIQSDGIYYRSKSGDKLVRLCSPLQVVALSRNPSGTGWGKLVAIKDPDGRHHRVMLPATLFAGDGTDLRSRLLDVGLNLPGDTAARAAFSTLLRDWLPPDRLTTSERLGWTDDTCTTFILGDGRVLGEKTVVFQEAHSTGVSKEIRPAGTLEDWKNAVGKPCIGNPVLILGVSLAFAGPLLELLEIEGGGIHLRGASSRGKSTVQRAAVSVWGSPRFLHTWRATTNGLEGIACACNATILALDELGESEGRDAGQAAYMLANGQGKSRANRNGLARPSARWRVLILSSGEISLSDKMQEGHQRSKAGQEVRLLDLFVDNRKHGVFDDLQDAGDGAAFATSLKEAASRAYGTAGPEFVAHILQDSIASAREIGKSDKKFVDAAETKFGLSTADPQVLRACQRFGLIAAAGETATGFNLTGWPRGAARDAAMDMLRTWLQGRGGIKGTEVRNAIRQTREFIARHGESRFKSLNTEGGRTSPDWINNRAGWKDSEYFYVQGDIWRNEVQIGLDPMQSARHLKSEGLLKSEGESRLTLKISADGERPRVYAIAKKILEFPDD